MRVTILFLVLFKTYAFGALHNDTIYLKDGNYIRCNIEEFNHDKIKINTSYSKGSFWIKALDIKELKSSRQFTFVFSDGSRNLGFIQHFNENYISIQTNDELKTYERSFLVHFRIIKKPFLDRFTSSFDFGFIFKKENSFQQYLLHTKVKYVNEKISLRFKCQINRVFKQNESPIKRSFLLTGIDYFMARRLYTESKLKFLESTEQNLRSRFSFSNAIGIRFVSNVKISGRASIGVSYNNERFDYNLNLFNSYELYSGIHLAILKYKDLSVEVSTHNYLSMSQTNRFRTDSELYFKYKLPKNFYLKSRLIYSFDSNPQIEIPTSDYVITNGIGWNF
ncbi:MAG: DUF481 domain-containing protein [Crocinitomicaceae bacterium]|nr:DUF481 domain-containing protein [Crocinitomicaceae bacterium]